MSPSPRLLAIDPSVRSTGVAIFLGGKLYRSAVIKNYTKYGSNCQGTRALDMALEIRDWTTKQQVVIEYEFDLVYEWPQIYTLSKSKGDPNSLLLTVAPAVVLSGLGDFNRVITPTPSEWAGQTKKVTTGDPWKSQRAQMVYRRLDETERSLVPKSHDAIDAVGLGLWALGRFERIRVNYGATKG